MSEPIILLFGGESRERKVSVATAQNLQQALNNPMLWFWSPDNQIFNVTPEELAEHKDAFLTSFKPKGKPAFKTLEIALQSPEIQDRIFLLGVHGGNEEDGTLQKKLEGAKLKFTGSNFDACAITFDKCKAKKQMEKLRVRVAPHIIVTGEKGKKTQQELKDFYQTHGAFALKPVADGSSFGYVLVQTEKDLNKAFKELESDTKKQYMAEQFIQGVELSVGVFEHSGELLALPCTEIRKETGRVFDYEGKYLAKGVQEITPAEVPEAKAQMAQRVAALAHETFGCSGCTRTDLIIDDKGPVFLETNTLPGLSKASIVTKQLAEKGISMRTFLNALITEAKTRD